MILNYLIVSVLHDTIIMSSLRDTIIVFSLLDIIIVSSLPDTIIVSSFNDTIIVALVLKGGLIRRYTNFKLINLMNYQVINLASFSLLQQRYMLQQNAIKQTEMQNVISK